MILWISVAIDLAFGDPTNRYHPVRWLGNFISFFSPFFRKLSNNAVSGFLFLLFVLAVFTTAVFLIQRFAALQIILYIMLSALMLKYTFALKSMPGHIRPILESLRNGEIDKARLHLSMVVRRPTSNLDVPHILGACIETLSEGFVDGFGAVVLYYGIFGILGSVAARVINTLDSMIGYRDELNIQFGKASAWADTILNFIPARLSAIPFILGARLMGNKVAFSAIRREASLTESRNAGWPMGTIALALDVKLEKINHYCLNSSGHEPDFLSVQRAIRLFYLADIVFLLMATAEILCLTLI